MMRKERAVGIDAGNKQNRISEGTKVVGNIESQSGFRTDGQVEGTVTSSGKVVLGKTAVVKGTIVCEEADIEGTVDGKLQIADLLTLRADANIEGEVVTQKLAVEPGATFNATCIMGGAVKNLETNVQKRSEQSA